MKKEKSLSLLYTTDIKNILVRLMSSKITEKEKLYFFFYL